MGGQILFVALVVGAIISWVIAGARAYEKGGSKLLTTYFFNLGGAIAAVFLLWFFIVYPVLNCSGFLCGLGEIIMWILSSCVLMLVWPLVLIVRYKRGMPEASKSVIKRQSEELIDTDDEIF